MNSAKLVNMVRSAAWHVSWLRFLILEFKYRRFLQRPLQKLFRSADARSDSRGSGPRVLIPIIETSHYQFYQILILAKALELRGARIKILMCGSRLDGCEIKSVLNTSRDPCMDCRFNHTRVLPHFSLETVQLADFISNDEVETLRKIAYSVARNYPRSYRYFGIDLVPITDDSVTRHFYGGLPAGRLTEIEQTRQNHLTSAMIGINVARRLGEEWDPDLVLNSMNVYSAWAPYFSYFELKGKRTFSLTVAPFNYHAVIVNSVDLYLTTARFQRYRDSRTTTSLNEKEKAVLKQFLDDRFSLRAQTFQDMDCFDQNRAPTDILQFDPSKRNLFLFANVFWDSGMMEAGSLFDGVIPWVLATINIVQEHPDCHLYIKPHPAEKFHGIAHLKGVVEFIRERYPNLPRNVTLILPEYKISPYDLFPFIDLGVVYNGTLGIEMILRQIPLALCGKAPYRNLGFAAEPQTLEEYRQVLLGELVGPKADLELADLFAYFYFIKALIPWNLTKRAYADDFKGYIVGGLDDLLPGRNSSLDHLCNCILHPESTVVEGW